MEDMNQQLPKTNAEWLEYYQSILAELTDNQKKISEPITPNEFFELPKMNENANSSWFAFPLIVKENAPFTRTDLQIYLEERNIQTRVIFTGNIIRQPAFKGIEKKISNDGYPVADRVMSRGFLLGNHHGLTEEMINHVHESAEIFIKKY